MRLSTSTNILFERTYEKPVDPLDCMEICQKAGFEVLDFCFHDLTTYDSEFMTDNWRFYMERVKAKADQLGIEFSQGHAVVYDFCRADVDHARFETILKKCVEGAGILGIKWLVMHPSTVADTAEPFKDSRRENIKFFTKWCAFAKEHGVDIAIENMWDCHITPFRLYCTTAEEMVDLIDAVPGLGACWDAEHGAIMQQNQAKALQLLGKRLKATHISDYTNNQDIHLLPYLGKTDWDDVMAAFASIDYEGDFDLEIHRYLTKMPMENVETAIRLSYEIGQGLLQLHQEKKGTNKA
ncbi:hypothetical protein BAU15_01735 [Enterococcus sp. JM4C]|uniref:sugar phosphate isomerase/epimerase family protein n=1 Tax=Candidatus Enterococcus huntleyi TaxID=1857217 RepID=UPI0013799078|nr:sugar phosphate isomerase/epimerase [Enterococcus sp. JM4C]KAF1299394.1 hypothetical protein BAU15_01735 [Enterococcus sp. JM4C]